MSLISVIQQLEAIQAQLTQNLKQGEFGLLNQRYQALCASISGHQGYQEKAAAEALSAEAQGLECLLPQNLFLFQDRLKELATQSAAAAETPPTSPIKEKSKLKAPSNPATPSAKLAALLMTDLVLDPASANASAAAVFESPEYLKGQIIELTHTISSKIAELNALVEAERRKFQAKIQGFFPDDASQESAELAGDLFDIFYSEGEGALLQKVRHLIVQDCEKEGQDFALSKDGKEDFSFDLWPENNFRDVYSGGKKPKKNAVYFWLDARHNEIGYVFSKSALGGGMITGDLYNHIIRSHEDNNKAIMQKNINKARKPERERALCLNTTVLTKLKDTILSVILPRNPDSELSYREKAMPQCLQKARFALLQKHSKIFYSLGEGVSKKHDFYFKEKKEAEGLANLFFEKFNMLKDNAGIFENFQLEKHKDIVLRRANKVQKLDSDFAANGKGLLEEAVTALNQKPIGIVFDYLQLAPDSAAAQANNFLMKEIDSPSPTCFSFFLLQKQNAGKQIKKICLVTVSGELRKLQGSTKLNQEMHKALKIAIEHTVEVLNQEGNPYQYQFKYHAEEKFGVDLALDQLNKVISGESKPLEVKSLNLKDPRRGCAEKKMIAYWIAQIKDKKVESLEMEGSANFFKYIDNAQDKFVPCCKNCQINKIPVLIFFKHLQDKKSKSMLKQTSSLVCHSAAAEEETQPAAVVFSRDEQYTSSARRRRRLSFSHE